MNYPYCDRCLKVDPALHADEPFEYITVDYDDDSKCQCLLNLAMKNTDQPDYRGLIIVHTPEMLEHIFGLSAFLYQEVGASLGQKHPHIEWRFPSGAKVYIRHFRHDTDVRVFAGVEFQFIGITNLPSLSLYQYDTIKHQCRTVSDKMKPVVRALVQLRR